MSVLGNELMKADMVRSVVNKTDKRSFYTKLTESDAQRRVVAQNAIFIMKENILADFSNFEYFSFRMTVMVMEINS